MKITFHAAEERINRTEFIELNIGFGLPIARKVVDKGHVNGAELHVITDTGIVRIVNVRTGKLITYLIARPGQLRNYSVKIPDSVYTLAKAHEAKGWNYI